MDVATAEALALGLADSVSGDFDTDAQVIPWINEAQRKVIMKAEPLVDEQSDTIAAASTSSIYSDDLQSDFWKIKRIEFGGRRMFFKEYDEFQDIVDKATTLSDAEYLYTLWDDKYLIYTSANYSVGDVITYQFFRWSANMALSSDTIDLPDEYVDSVPLYVAFKMAQVNRESSLSSQRLSEFRATVAETKKESLRIRSGPRYLKREIRDKYAFRD